MTRFNLGAWLVSIILLIMVTSLWAAEGWYLLVPPRSEYNENTSYLSGYKILDKKPLSQWGHQSAYDSASECEAVRNSLLMVEQNVYSKSSEAYQKAIGEGADQAALKTQRYITEKNNANVWALMASRCIRSDDPRLALTN
ncbi:hypothetical protein BMS3Bbin08_01601 [bacterium BMS3Bbin08]|nr:hypothetical protein BMS3Bbin08_01601 [bacterium BMS3Bbin08]